MDRKIGKKLLKVEGVIAKIIMLIEVLLAFLVMVTLLLSLKDLVILGITVFKTEAIFSYEILQGFLSHTLLIVVGLELALMLISHTPGKVLEVTLYAIARKMLISSANMTDMLLGVVALAMLFFIDKFLHSKESKKIL